MQITEALLAEPGDIRRFVQQAVVSTTDEK